MGAELFCAERERERERESERERWTDEYDEAKTAFSNYTNASDVQPLFTV